MLYRQKVARSGALCGVLATSEGLFRSQAMLHTMSKHAQSSRGESAASEVRGCRADA